MTDVDIRTQIRHLLDGPPDSRKREMQELAEMYGERLGRALGRMARCSTWLGRGLRCEAVHLADESPALLDELASLDLGERLGSWRELCAMNGFEVGGPIEWESVTELNEAYEKERSLARLLRRHRQLALSRAPLPRRIEILRRLRDHDPDNPIWEQDLVELERVRVTDINRLAKVALEQGDRRTLQIVEGELSAHGWTHSPPRELMDAVHSARREVEHRLAALAYARVAEQAHKAVAAMDRSTLDRLHEEWMGIQREYRSDAPAQAQEDVRPAFDWLNEQYERDGADEAHSRACRQLEESLDERAPIDTLERLRARALSFERGIPDVLEQRCNHRRSEHGIERSRRHRLLVLGAVAAVALTAAVVTWTVVQRAEQTRLRSWSERIAVAMGNAQTDEAAALLDQCRQEDPRLFRQPPIQDLHVKLQASLAADADRRQAFLAAIEAAEASGLEQPDRDALDRAIKLAATDGENHRTTIVRDRIEAAAARRQKERDEAFAIALDAIREDRLGLERSSALASTDPQETQRRVIAARALLKQLTELVARKEISVELLRSATPEQRAVETMAQALGGQSQRLDAMLAARDRIEHARNSPGQLAEELAAFIQSFPETALGQEFKRTLALAPAWKAVEAWRMELKNPAANWPADLAVAEYAAAELLSVRLARHMTEHPQPPLRSGFEQYAAYLAAAKKGLHPGRSPSDRLTDFLENQLIAELQVVRGSDGTRYYTLGGELSPIQGGYTLTESVDAAEDILPRARRPGKILDAERLQDPRIEPSGQRVWATTVGDRLQRFDWHGWDRVYLSLLQDLSSAGDMDQILRFVIAHRLYAEHQQDQWIEDPAVATWFNRAEKARQQVEVNWMTPEPNATIRRARELAAQLLGDMPDPASVEDRVLEQWQRIHGALRPRRCAGIVWPDQQGRRAAALSEPSMHLEMIAPDGAGGYIFVEVTLGGDGVIDGSMDAPFGTPLYGR